LLYPRLQTRAEVHFEAGPIVPADKARDEFRPCPRAVGEPISYGRDPHFRMARLPDPICSSPPNVRDGDADRKLILLANATMVVVEGVARSLNPHINIWEVVEPVVTDYHL